ncbi:MAG: hypothetical protein CM15mP58_09850 [Burkholderiaceae bacterium]|nr:MAG: hypothetical protein CM15mP58_09850 [Burkholderiaceae bacterium]
MQIARDNNLNVKIARLGQNLQPLNLRKKNCEDAQSKSQLKCKQFDLDSTPVSQTLRLQH